MTLDEVDGELLAGNTVTRGCVGKEVGTGLVGGAGVVVVVVVVVVDVVELGDNRGCEFVAAAAKEINKSIYS